MGTLYPFALPLKGLSSKKVFACRIQVILVLPCCQSTADFKEFHYFCWSSGRQFQAKYICNRTHTDQFIGDSYGVRDHLLAVQTHELLNHRRQVVILRLVNQLK